MQPRSPQTPPAWREDVVDAGAEEAEEENGYGKEEECAYLATAFGLPARCGRGGRLWHGFECDESEVRRSTFQHLF
jgi:hypothetical protein